jgi:hypothetical protein
VNYEETEKQRSSDLLLDLKPGTPVIVECGMIWSFDKHDEMLKKEQKPMLGLSANQISVKLLRPLVQK